MNTNQTGSSSFPFASLYVGNLDEACTEAMLFEKFSTAGPVLSIRVCRDIITRRSLGYAYVNFHHPADAESALETMNYDVMKNKSIRIMWSQRDPSMRHSGVGNVFIKNLNKSIGSSAMHDSFSALGKVISCKVANDETDSCKGYDSEHFETEESARKCIQKVDCMLLNGKKANVGRFIPQAEREHKLGDRKIQPASQYMQRVTSMRMQHANLLFPVGPSNSYVPATLQAAGNRF